MMKERESSYGKDNPGRATIDDERRGRHHSKRAGNGDLQVVKRRCQNCGHQKAFVANGKTRCTRCRHEAKK